MQNNPTLRNCLSFLFIFSFGLLGCKSEGENQQTSQPQKTDVEYQTQDFKLYLRSFFEDYSYKPLELDVGIDLDSAVDKYHPIAFTASLEFAKEVDEIELQKNLNKELSNLFPSWNYLGLTVMKLENNTIKISAKWKIKVGTKSMRNVY